MKNQFLLIIITIAFIQTLKGQVDESRNYVYLYPDSVVYGQVVEYKKPNFEKKIVVVDDKEFTATMVKFYNTERGFFANTQFTKASGSVSFTERIRKGRINLFETESTNYSPGFYNGTTGFYSGGGTTRSFKYYYNKGFGDLKKASYNNLVVDLADNPQSMAHLGKYKSIRGTQTAFTVAGSVLVLGGLVSLISATSNVEQGQPQPKVGGQLAVIGVGAVSFWVAYFISFGKPKQLKKAVEAYNQ